MLNKRLKPVSTTPPPIGDTPPSSPTSPAAGPAAPGVTQVAPAAEATPTALDPQALKRLHDLDPNGDNKLLERVLKAFEASVGRLQPMLLEAHANGDLAGISHVAHTLKSSSASIGAIKLSQMCAEIEMMIRQGSGGDLGPRVENLSVEIDLVVQSLRSLLQNK